MSPRARFPVHVAMTALAFVACSQETGAAQSVRLDLSKNTNQDIARPDGSLPMLLSPITPATNRINAVITKANKAWAQFEKDCRGTVSHADFEATRSAHVAMNGPRYLSLVISEEWNCPGTPHPDHDTVALVYDLQTGRPLDWTTMLPARLLSRLHVEEAGCCGPKIAFLSSPDLDRLYVRTLKATERDTQRWSNCSDAINDASLDFVAWPDAKQNGVVLQPVLAHAVAACADEALVSVSNLRSLGAAERFVRAIEEGHSQLEASP